MKLLIRCFGMIVFTLFVTLIIIHFNNTNYMINEMHNASYIAAKETMDKEIKYLKGDLDDIKLEEEFKLSFKNLVRNIDNYSLSLKADKEHGIINFKINCNKRDFIKEINLTNIIEHFCDIEEEQGLDNIDISAFSRATRTDNILYEKEFEEAKLLNSFYIDIEAYTRSNGESILNRYEPEMIITIIDEFDKTTVYTKPPVTGMDTLDEVNFDSDNYDFEPMKVKYVKLLMKGIPKNSAPKADLLRIGSTKKNYFEYEGKRIEHHTLYSRYVDKTYDPQNNSLWSKDDYQNILKDYLA